VTQEEILKTYENLDLRKLPEKLTQGGIDYYLVDRTKSKAIYQQEKPAASFEVFITKIVPERETAKSFSKRFNRPCELSQYQDYKEIYPHSSEFGKRAWSYPRLELAKQKYDSLS
jgi:hypothetical protein